MLEAVVDALMTAGVRVSKLTQPEEAIPIIIASRKRNITKEESSKLLSIFSLSREELLAQIDKAGRKPEANRGGFLNTSEEGAAPYPKVYDMKAITPEVRVYLQGKFGKLHVNSAENGIGIDEVMTVISGGHWTWFFLLPDNVVGKLTLGYIDIGNYAWRISYPGLIPHGAFLDSNTGLVVAHAHGPKKFIIRYEEPSVKGAELLGTNPWIDFTKEKPKLLE